MTQGPQITGIAAWILLVLPYAVLAVVVALAVRRRAAPGTNGSASAPRGRYGAPLGTQSTSAREPVVEREAGKGSEARSGEGGPGGPASALEHTEGAGDEGEQADFHLIHARQHLAADRVNEAADHLRKSIRIAARIGKKKVHAEARLELAEIARASGDLTTACEHWQIARGLFSDLRHTKDVGKAEALMRQHGCPTDWVLNDF